MARVYMISFPLLRWAKHHTFRSPVTSRSRSGSLVSNSNHLLPSGGPLNNSNSTYDNSARQAFHALLDTVREHYEMKLLRIAGCLAEKVFASPFFLNVLLIKNRKFFLQPRKKDER